MGLTHSSKGRDDIAADEFLIGYQDQAATSVDKLTYQNSHLSPATLAIPTRSPRGQLQCPSGRTTGRFSFTVGCVKTWADSAPSRRPTLALPA